jgi:hypothetical protein
MTRVSMFVFREHKKQVRLRPTLAGRNKSKEWTAGGREI